MCCNQEFSIKDAQPRSSVVHIIINSECGECGGYNIHQTLSVQCVRVVCEVFVCPHRSSHSMMLCEHYSKQITIRRKEKSAVSHHSYVCISLYRQTFLSRPRQVRAQIIFGAPLAGYAHNKVIERIPFKSAVVRPNE